MVDEDKRKKKSVKAEDVAEETGKLIGKGVKKTWRVVKGFGKGVVTAVEGKEKPVTPTYCPNCGTLIPPKSSFCSSCGKKL